LAENTFQYRDIVQRAYAAYAGNFPAALAYLISQQSHKIAFTEFTEISIGDFTQVLSGLFQPFPRSNFSNYVSGGEKGRTVFKAKVFKDLIFPRTVLAYGADYLDFSWHYP
jgi:hypothetical protein